VPTECSATLFEFAAVEGRQVVAAFGGGAITSDAGALLLGETDRAIRLIPAVAAIAPLRFLQFATEEARSAIRFAAR
jgi:hypothetical protein